MASKVEAALARVRKLCLSLPDVSERPSHGAPTFFFGGKKSFATFLDNHHGDGRLAVWCAAPPDAQAMLVDSDPEVFFVPPYVGHLGWVGVRLDRRAPWPVVARVLEDAHASRMTRPRAAPETAKAPRPRVGAAAPARPKADAKLSSGRGSYRAPASRRSAPSARRSRS
jgi:hypothetical protein